MEQSLIHQILDIEDRPDGGSSATVKNKAVMELAGGDEELAEKMMLESVSEWIGLEKD